MDKTVWVVSGTTESGDDWVLLFNSRPSNDIIEKCIMADDWLREEWEADCIQGWCVIEQKVLEVDG